MGLGRAGERETARGGLNIFTFKNCSRAVDLGLLFRDQIGSYGSSSSQIIDQIPSQIIDQILHHLCLHQDLLALRADREAYYYGYDQVLALAALVDIAHPAAVTVARA